MKKYISGKSYSTPLQSLGHVYSDHLLGSGNGDNNTSLQQLQINTKLAYYLSFIGFLPSLPFVLSSKNYYSIILIDCFIINEYVKRSTISLLSSPQKCRITKILEPRLLKHSSFVFQIYKYIHKKHHEWTASISWVGLYSNPIEHIFSNLVPVYMGLLICGSHVATSKTKVFLFILNATKE